VVTVTLATGTDAFGVAFALRALGLRVAVLGAVAVLGINALRVYSFIIHMKKPLERGFVTNCCKKVQFVNCPRGLVSSGLQVGQSPAVCTLGNLHSP